MGPFPADVPLVALFGSGGVFVGGGTPAPQWRFHRTMQRVAITEPSRNGPRARTGPGCRDGIVFGQRSMWAGSHEAGCSPAMRALRSSTSAFCIASAECRRRSSVARTAWSFEGSWNNADHAVRTPAAFLQIGVATRSSARGLGVRSRAPRAAFHPHLAAVSADLAPRSRPDSPASRARNARYRHCAERARGRELIRAQCRTRHARRWRLKPRGSARYCSLPLTRIADAVVGIGIDPTAFPGRSARPTRRRNSSDELLR